MKANAKNGLSTRNFYVKDVTIISTERHFDSSVIIRASRVLCLSFKLFVDASTIEWNVKKKIILSGSSLSRHNRWLCNVSLGNKFEFDFFIDLNFPWLVRYFSVFLKISTDANCWLFINTKWSNWVSLKLTEPEERRIIAKREGRTSVQSRSAGNYFAHDIIIHYWRGQKWGGHRDEEKFSRLHCCLHQKSFSW